METKTIANLKDKWTEFKAENPKVRIRDAAKQLGVSEAELLATECGNTVTRLQLSFKDFFANEVVKLGEVKAITRNEHVVHERVGTYLNAEFNEHSPVGLFVGEDIDLRIFLQSWTYAFAVEEEARGDVRQSIQFFDRTGTALHKIYLTSKSNVEAYKEIVAKYTHETQSTEQEVGEEYPVSEARNPSPEVEAFKQGWTELKDTHNFFGLLKRHKVSRLQALELAPEGLAEVPSTKYAIKVDNNSIRQVLDTAAERQVPIMVFVGNRGIIQIHTGGVKKVLPHGEWYNVLDPEFNLHLRETAVKECWIVRKPTEDGLVSSLEVFDQNEELICTFFGKRKPGIPEDTAWKQILDEIETATIA